MGSNRWWQLDEAEAEAHPLTVRWLGQAATRPVRDAIQIAHSLASALRSSVPIGKVNNLGNIA